MKKDEKNLSQPGSKNDLKEVIRKASPESFDGPKLNVNHEDEIGQTAKAKPSATPDEPAAGAGPDNDLKETPLDGVKTNAPVTDDSPLSAPIVTKGGNKLGQVITTTVEEITTGGEEFKKAWHETDNREIPAPVKVEKSQPEDQAEIDEMMKVVKQKMR